MFRLRKEVVKITNEDGTVDVYNVVPLNGKYLPELYSVIKAFPQEATEDNDKLLDALGTDVSEKLHKLVLETLKKSYPTESEENLDVFAAQNMFRFLEAILKVNVPQGD